MKQFFLIYLILISIISISSKELRLNRTGHIYRAGTNNSELLYIQKELIEGNNIEGSIVHNYYNIKNELVAYERVELKGYKIVDYESSIDGTDYIGYLRLEKNKFNIIKEQNGKLKSKAIEYREDLIVGPLFSYFLSNNITELKQGKEVRFNLPFIEFLTLASMKFVKNERAGLAEGTIAVNMIPKNLILSLFIDPIEFILNSDTGSVMEIHGQTILPDPDNPKSNNLINADIYYKYGE